MKTAKAAAGWMRMLIDNGMAAKCGNAWLTYCVLRRHANPRKGMAWSVVMDTLTTATGLSVWTVQRHLAHLDAIGLIDSWVAAKKGGGRRALVKIHNKAKRQLRRLVNGEPNGIPAQRSQTASVPVTFNEQTARAKRRHRRLGSNSPTGSGCSDKPPAPEGGYQPHTAETKRTPVQFPPDTDDSDREPYVWEPGDPEWLKPRAEVV